MEQGRTVLDPILARNPNLKVSAKVANHTGILRKDSPPSPRPYASSPPPAEPCAVTIHFSA